MSLVFNLVWINPRPPSDRAQDVAYNGPNNLRTGEDVEAVILFPSLMTPMVSHEKGGPWIEVLLASKATVTVAHVNRQLKIDEGLEPDKRFHADWLFNGWGNKIEVEPASKDGELLRTHEVFEGMIHPMFEKRLSDAGFTKFFRVRFDRSAFRSRPLTSLRAALKAKGAKLSANWRPEAQDNLVKAMLETRNVVDGYQSLPYQGAYAFKLDANGPRREFDAKNPIQAYHPVYLFGSEEPEVLNFGHLTDIHLNYRLEILKGTPARVIEGAGAAAVSPPIKDLLQTTNQSFTQLLNQVASSSDAHALVIGGDLIDHQINAWSGGPIESTMTKIWDAVDVTSKGVKQGYMPGVDIIGFYSLLLDFCRKKAKPVFGIAGNHDTYLEPFGISPRALGMRANAGIPADLNLTLYEAVLAFGPSFADFSLPGAGSQGISSFDADWMEWFYTVFTPFGEASIRLPKQRVVCLGWGNHEDMTLGGQGTTHLPRADDSVSPVQLKLIKKATDKHQEHRVILVSHFTVASFDEAIPLLTNGAPTVGSLHSGANPEDLFNMGTFELNHDAFVNVLGERKITCILTGHSHRRGLYFLGDMQQSTGSRALVRRLPVTIHDPAGYKWDKPDPKTKREPAIIVSDSAGPFPRYNERGEFLRWGSDRPGGSIVKFAPDGSVSGVDVIRSGANKPRLAVSLDYADVEQGGLVWEHPIRTTIFSVQAEREAMRKPTATWSYVFEISLRRGMTDIGLRVEKVELFAAGADAPALTLAVGGASTSPVKTGASRNFFDWTRQTQAGGLFVAVTFSWSNPLADRYDTQGAWIYEVLPTLVPIRGAMAQGRYELTRPLRSTDGKPSLIKYADLPDFERRKQAASGNGPIHSEAEPERIAP